MTKKALKLFEFIKTYINKNKYSPSYDDKSRRKGDPL